ncbi:ABC-F type ribosomal protection protein [Evansella sp. AB-P1]|uniref:Vga family ABC-F type ribosomal protection protein n=1 Tax=Evansella sp. AB-P1 TaxID=3037653 RepID=UPI00241F9323|nr:ABC-F type ribosomal protection protein [Evansella sp. AB-P1]MDG5788058.1 ABC-F type ribosomal protection protein [Evansella sp. AB-P1]
MLLMDATNIKHYVIDRLLLDIPKLQIFSKDRIGLVGKNGTGKTTLMNILAKRITPSEGSVNMEGTYDILPQLKRSDTTKSGGEITQEYITAALSKDPAILFADEPTTNLDTNHIEWVEKKLANWQGALVIVSHDRAFLDALCTTIWEISAAGKLTVHKGNYSDFSTKKELEKQQHEMAYEKYQRKKKQLEEAIDRKSNKADKATKKPKSLSSSEAKITGSKPYFAKKQKKLQQNAKAIETRLEKLEKVEKPFETKGIKMTLPNEEDVKGRILLRAVEATGMAGSRKLWDPVSFHILGGEKLAIIGPNGSGKTTLVKMIMNKSESLSLSPSMKIGYFSQNLSILNTNSSILENVQTTSIQDETFIRTVLARLHFKRDDVYKKVDVLSGGERVKVALAKLFVSNSNTLVLDEPTNYLDIEAVEALEGLLQEYEGTVLFVSHDRRFVENIATRILAIKHQKIELFDGTLQQYHAYEPAQERDLSVEKLAVLETKIADVLSRLSIEPTAELEAEFQKLLSEKRRLKKL